MYVFPIELKWWPFSILALYRSPSPRSRSRSRGRSPIGSSYKERRYSRDSPPAKVHRSRRQSPSPPPKQRYGGRRSRSYSPAGRRSRTPDRGYHDRPSKTYRDPSPEYYQKSKDSQQMPTYVVVNRERSYSPDRRQGNDRQLYDDRRDEPRDLDARLREMEARSPEITKARNYAKDDYSRNSPKDSFGAGMSYEKNRHGSTTDYRRSDRSPDGYQDDKFNRSSRDYAEPARKDTYDDNYQASGRSYSPPRQSRDQRRNTSPTERRRSKDAKYKRSPDRYQSPEPERKSYKGSDSRRHDRESNDNHDRSKRDEKYSEKKERSGRDRSNHGSSSRDGYEKSRRSSTSDKTRQDRESEREHKPTFDPTLVIVPRRKDEGRGGIFNRPEITMRPVTDDPDNQQMPFEEKRVVAVMPGKPLPGPAVADRDLHRDYLELLARKSATIGGDFEVRSKDKYRDLGLDAPQTLSSRFQGASSLDLLATLENFEINRTKNLARELELRREMDLLRDRSPLRLSDLQSDLEGRISVMERKVEPKNPRDLRHDLESRRKQLKSGRTETVVSPRRVTKKAEKESKLRMTSADRRPVRERLGLSPGKKERRSFDRRVEDRDELPDFKKEVEELQKAQWMEDPKSVPKGPGYFEVSIKSLNYVKLTVSSV